jgi:hypothetical protein
MKPRAARGWRKLTAGVYRSADGRRDVARSAFGDWYLWVRDVDATYVFPTMRSAMRGVGGHRLEPFVWAAHPAERPEP